MQLKQKNSSVPLLLSVLLTGALLVFATWKSSFDVMYEEFYESVMGLDPGYSMFPGLPTLLSDSSQIIDGKINGFEGRPEVETVYIEINPQEYRTLLQDRDRAIATNALTNPQEVNASIRMGGEQLKADVRLKGDMRDHWLSKRRMSLRVKLKNDGSVLGFNEFSIQKPFSRQHPFDSVFQELIRTSGSLGSVHEYVNVVFNGKPWGIMIMEEAMTSEYLEKLQRKESVIVRFSNEEKGIIQERSTLLDIPFYEDYRISDDRLYLKMYEENRNAQNLSYRKWFTHIAENRINSTELESDLYDVEEYGKVLFINAIWNDGHPLWYANARHYFNPYTLQLQPVTTDSYLQMSIRASNTLYPRDQFDPRTKNTVFNTVIASPEFQNNKDSLFGRAAAAYSGIENIYDKYYSYFPLDPRYADFESVLFDNIFNLNHKPNRENLFAPFDMEPGYRGIAPENNQLSLLTDHVHFRHFEDGRVDVYNLLPEPVYLDRFVIDGIVEVRIDRELPPYNPVSQDRLTMQTALTGFLDSRLAIHTRFRDQSRATLAGLSLATHDMHNPLLIETESDAYTFLSKTDEGWVIEPGNWVIDAPVVLDGNLIVSEGTTLCFADSAYMIVKGAMNAIGNQEQPIEFSACEQSWKGIYVLNAEQESSWTHVRAQDYTATSDGLLNLTGGVTFYKSDVTMTNVELSGVQGEDALNIVHSQYELRDLSILDTASDGMDSDFSTGLITDVVLSNINGDALDFSGSEVEIRNIRADGIYDKAISVGEGSNVDVQGGVFSNVGVAVVSKDGSTTNARDLEIAEYVLAGAMSYQKKSFYETASLALENISVTGESPFIRQTGSNFFYNGEQLPAQDIDVDFMYENTVMKK